MLKVAVRLLFDQPSKNAGTLLGVVLSTFLMAQQLSTFLGILGRVAAFVDGTAVDVWIASPTTVDVDITGTVPTRYRAGAASTDGVAWAAPVVQGMSSAVRPDGVRELVKVVGVERPRFAGAPNGSASAGLGAPGRVLINAADRPLYGNAVAGDRLEVGGRTMIVGGFFEGVEPHGNYAYTFTNLTDARMLLAVPEDRSTFIAVGLEPGRKADEVAAHLADRFPEAKVFTHETLRRATLAQFMRRTPVGVVFGMGIVVAGLVGSLVVGVTMFSAVVDRTRDFGTLLAIGARRNDLARLLVAQTLLFFGAGSTLGLAAFGLVKIHATSAPMLAPPWMIAAVAFASLVSCVVASLVAIRRVLSLDPAIVFRS